MKTNKLFTIAALAAVSLASGAHAADGPVFDQVRADRSRIEFVSRQMGVPVKGHFDRFDTELYFDAGDPAKSRVKLELDLASIDAGSAEANEEVVGKNWFDVANTPKAVFVSSAVKPLGDNRYEVTGTLTLKGTTQDVVAPVSVTRQGDVAAFDGGFTLKRLEFGIGEGLWGDPSVVANDVEVRFHVVAGTGE